MGAFHSDLQTLTARKNIGIKNYQDRGTATDVFYNGIEVAVQTVGQSYLFLENLDPE